MLQNNHSLSWRRGAIRGRRTRWLLVLSLACSLCVSATAQDQDDDEFVPAPLAERQIVITEQQFDQMMFGGRPVQQVQVVINGVQHVEVARKQAMDERQKRMDDCRTRMEFSLFIEIQWINAYCSWSEAQTKKLRLAGRGDISQYFDRVADLRRICTGKALTQPEYTAIRIEMSRFRSGQQDELFGECSLFQKTLRHMLTAEQQARYRALVRYRQVMMVETLWTNVNVPANEVKIPVPSRQSFIDVLVDHGDLPPTQSRYTYYIVLLEAGKLEDRLKPILSEVTWMELQRQIGRAKQMEVILRNSGRWPARPAEDDEGLDNTAKE